MAILVIAALVIVGPERLPGAMQWLAKTLKQVREYATGAQNQLKQELGPEFEDLKKPFDELRGMRGMTPRGVITKHLLDGDDSLFTGNFEEKPKTNGAPSGNSQTAPSQAGASQPASPQAGAFPPGRPAAGQAGAEPAPARYDTDAT